MPIFQFKQESYRFYRVHAKTKEDALKILEDAQLSDDEDESDLELHYDRTETCMDFEFDGEYSDTTSMKTYIPWRKG